MVPNTTSVPGRDEEAPEQPAATLRSLSDELTRRLAQQSAVARLGELALRRGGARELMDGACIAATEALGVEIAFVAQRGDDGELRVAAAVGCGDELVGTHVDPAHLGSAPHGPLVIDDLARYPELHAGLLGDHGVVAGVAVAIGDPGTPHGLLGAYTLERRTFSAHDLDFLHSVAHVVTSAVEQRRTQRRIRHDALHDPLTGLPNRTLLRDRLSGALSRESRAGWRVALLCVDVDRLKVFNESLGHDAGDALLQAIGPRLAHALRPGDTVARFSGDGFTVLCEAVADEAHAARIGERLVRAFDAPFTIAGAERFVSASVGIAVAAPGHGEDAMIANAEAAMYRAKERGRGRHELYDAAQRARVAARLRTEHDLRGALHSSDQLWVAYQPIHQIGGGIAAVEALARWDHPEQGDVPPSDFVPIAEECGLIGALGLWILRDACSQVARWRATTPVHDLSLSVNVSARQVTAAGLVEEVTHVLAETGLEPSALWLELTEGLLLEDSTGVIETLHALRALGVRIVLDDFGTGFSSLGYLRRYPIDIIKIDRAFIADLGEDGHGDAAIVSAIVGMAHALGMRTVPEGVETAGQLERLIALDCDFAQGYHLGHPLRPAQLETLLRGEIAPN